MKFLFYLNRDAVSIYGDAAQAHGLVDEHLAKVVV